MKRRNARRAPFPRPQARSRPHVMDYKIDNTGNVVFKEGGFEYVSGYEEFEQQLALWLQHIYLDVIGTTLPEENIIEKLRIEASRVADEFDLITDVTSFRAERVGPDSYELFITYDADGDRLTELFIGVDNPIEEPLKEEEHKL